METADLESIADAHHQEHDYCTGCSEPWPCATALAVDELMHARPRLAAAEAREAVLREALAWYADESNYDMPITDRLDAPEPICEDWGARARAALATAPEAATDD